MTLWFKWFNRFARFKPSNALKIRGESEDPGRMRYLRWVFDAKKRFGLSILNYIVTCNHVDLLVRGTGPNFIANSTQLIAGRTGREYNQRKGRHGAFWEDRYHATAIAAGEHLHRRLILI
jgi:hypothetical protein